MEMMGHAIRSLKKGRDVLSIAAALAVALLPGALELGASAQTPQPAPAAQLMAHGHYLRAQRLVQAALAKNQKDLAALVDDSILQWAFFHNGEFLSVAQKAVATDGNSAAAHAQLTNALGLELANSKASFMTRLNAAREYRKQLDLTLQLDPNNADAVQDLAEYEWHAPGMAGGDKAKAQQGVDKLARIDAARAYALRAEFAADETDKAKRQAAVEAVWKQAVAALPGSYRAHAGLAAAYFDEGGAKLALAEQEAKKAEAVDATRIAAYQVLAEVYTSQGRWSDLDAELKRARAGVPDDLSPEYKAASLILTGNVGSQIARAEAYLGDYLKQPAEGLEPPLATAHWKYGLVLEKEGRKNDAVREVQVAVNMDGSLADAKKDLKRME